MISEIKKDENNPFLNQINYKLDDKIVGYLTYREIYDRYEIDDFKVEDDYQNQKIGQALLKYLIDKAKKLNMVNITLEVKKTNEKAIHIYHKYGFKKVAIRKDYYDGIDALLMEKKLR